LELDPPNTIGDAPAREMECIRCREKAVMRFYGLCDRCRDELRAKFDVQGRDVEVADYQPKMNVTPNAVALKDD